MKDRLLQIGIIGAIIAALCCFTPVLVILLGTVGLSSLTGYLDVVLRGYTEVFGQGGARAFMATTDGWETPILDDRASPCYPRHQEITAEERTLHDTLIAEAGARVLADGA